MSNELSQQINDIKQKMATDLLKLQNREITPKEAQASAREANKHLKEIQAQIKESKKK